MRKSRTLEHVLITESLKITITQHFCHWQCETVRIKCNESVLKVGNASTFKISYAHRLLEWPRKYWDIEGILPAMKDGPGGPIYCDTNSTFDEDALEPIKDELKIYWPDEPKHNQDGKKPKTVWEKAWTKYGSCITEESEEVVDERDYFTLGTNPLSANRVCFFDHVMCLIIQHFNGEQNTQSTTCWPRRDFSLVPRVPGINISTPCTLWSARNPSSSATF